MSKPVGPYSPSMKAGEFVFTSGQIGLKDGAIVSGGVLKELEQALANLRKVLEDAGTNPSEVIKTTVFLTDMDDYKSVNATYVSFFGDHRPARSAVAVASLPLDAKIEIEAIAHRP